MNFYASPLRTPLTILVLLTLISQPLYAAEQTPEILLRIATDLRGQTAASREAAILTLAKKGDAALPMLHATAQSEETVERQIAARVLGMIGNPKSEPLLLEMARQEDPFTAAAARRALGELYTRYPPQDLATRLSNMRDRNIVLAALYGVYLQCQRGDGNTKLNEAIEPGVRAWADHDNPYRVAALATLAYGKQEESARVLIEALRAQDAKVVLEALRALRIMLPAGGARHIEPLTKHPNAAVILEAHATLGQMNYKGVEDAYVQFLTHPDPALRIRAIALLTEVIPQGAGQAVGGVGTPGTTGGKRRYLQDLMDVLLKEQAQEVRLAAVQALMEIGDPSAGPTLARLIGDGGDEDSKVRAAAAVALARLGQPGWASALTSDARGKNNATKETRLDAIRALGMIADPSTLRALLDCLDDPDPEIAGLAADALGNLPDKRAGKALYKQLRRGLAHVPLRARMALTRLYGEDPGDDPEVWPAWAMRHGIGE